jgi:uncharacterized damage-inducible protein DinB
MSIREYFFKRWEQEQPKFAKVIQAMPEGKLDYTPHERSTKAGDLAWQLVEEQRMLSELVEHGVIPFNIGPRPESASEIAAAWDKQTEALRPKLAALDQQTWDRNGEFKMGEHVVGNSPTGEFLWGFLFDMVHHRGQLTTYLRPMGGKVPSIYGPSADDDGTS